MSKMFLSLAVLTVLLTVAWSRDESRQGDTGETGALDVRVRQFLSSRQGSWHDLNVPEADGRHLYDVVLNQGYKSALEIGTSTGHSGIWIAWALAKTGGRLVTIEIDRYRYQQAMANFKAAGLSEYIDARLGDAHKLVPELAGPFDFVFCDADKDWYNRYLEAVLPKLTVGGCFAAHNVSERGRWRMGGSRDFLSYARSFPSLETTVFEGGAGMSLSFKKSE
jgi:caffeoyl-CoA O-methyltransferase